MKRPSRPAASPPPPAARHRGGEARPGRRPGFALPPSQTIVSGLWEPATSPASTVDVRCVRAVTDPLRRGDRQALRHQDQLRGVFAAKVLELRPGLIQRLDFITGLLQA